jgi:hypothetical protein
MVWKFFCLSLTAICFPVAAYAATFTEKCDAQMERISGCTIIMTGEIVKGDNQKLIDLLRTKKGSGSNFFRTLLLQSPGGSISEALLISQTVIQNVLDTRTTAFWRREYPLSESHCVSACFLIWVAGAERVHFSSPPKPGFRPMGLGLHRPYFSKEEFSALDPLTASKAQQDLVAQVRAYLKRNDVPDHLIDEMIKHSSKEVYWLDTLGGSDELDQRAPWFEELMISRCNFDPVKDTEANLAIGNSEVNGKKLDPAERQKYMTWKYSYNACEYEFRKSSQTKFLAAK